MKSGQTNNTQKHPATKQQQQTKNELKALINTKCTTTATKTVPTHDIGLTKLYYIRKRLQEEITIGWMSLDDNLDAVCVCMLFFFSSFIAVIISAIKMRKKWVIRPKNQFSFQSINKPTDNFYTGIYHTIFMSGWKSVSRLSKKKIADFELSIWEIQSPPVQYQIIIWKN